MKRKTEIITLKIEKEIKDDFRKLAIEEGRTISNKIQHLIKMELIKSKIKRKCFAKEKI